MGTLVQDRDAPGSTDIHTIVISDAAELVAAIVNDLPPDVRKVVEAHFFDGGSVYKVQRRLKTRRREVEATLETALETKRTALRSRGVRAVADVI